MKSLFKKRIVDERMELQSPLATAVISFLLLFFFMFGLMYLVDSLCFRIGKKRAFKDSEEEEE